LAAALGANLPVYEPPATALLDLGAGASGAAILAGGQILLEERFPSGGDALDEAIRLRVADALKLILTNAEAEAAKRAASAALTDQEAPEVSVMGREQSTGLPGERRIQASWIAETIEPFLSALEAQMLHLLARCEPDWLHDLGRSGICLTGGGALLPGLDRRLSARLDFACWAAPNPAEATARGIQRLMGELSSY
jgi:rod shape-determining protein MreB